MPLHDTEPLPPEASGSDDITRAEPPRLGARAATSPDEHYELGAEIGRGGMGAVIAARDAVIGRDVAIKRLLAERPSAEAEARFLREAQIQGRLDHPSIPPVYELGRDGEGRPYIVMKRLVGTTLAEILEATDAGRVASSRERLLRAFIDVCLAVELAHTRGVIHRDLKPSNIMLGEFGEVYVLDWGVAKVLGDPSGASSLPAPGSNDSTRAGTVIGTPLYMAPEQRLACADLDGRADVYALGRILCEVVAGRRVRSPAQTDDERRPSHHAPDLDVAPELDEACLAATANDRDERLASPRALAERVQRYLDGDRDLALRRRLAAGHLERAIALHDRSADDDAHGAAMREAGRALALDPTLAPAADLVGRLMLETPRAVPPEVERSLAVADATTVQSTARVGMVAYPAYLLFVPALVATGFRAPQYLIPFVAAAAVLTFTAWYGATRPEAGWRIPLVLLGNAAMVTLCARIFTTFLVAPGIAAITAMVLFRSPSFRRKWMAPTVAVLILAVLGPWVCERAGYLPATYSYVPGGGILLRPEAIVTMREWPVGLGLVVYTTFLVVIAALISRSHAREQRAAEEKLHLQAWRMRQLAPAPAGA